MIYRTRIDAVEKLLDSKEIKYTGEVISLSEFRNIIIEDINEYNLLAKYNMIKEKFNEDQYKEGIFGISSKVRNPIIKCSNFTYEDGVLKMYSFINRYGRMSINADKNGIENFSCDLRKKDLEFIKEFIVDHKDEFNEFLFGIMDYVDSFDTELEESYFKGKVGSNISGDVLNNIGLSYSFRMNHFMLEPIVSITYKSCGDKPIFIGESYNVEEKININDEAIKKRTPIEISTLNPAFVKKIEKYR